jgi:hypothetical protein
MLNSSEGMWVCFKLHHKAEFDYVLNFDLTMF